MLITRPQPFSYIPGNAFCTILKGASSMILSIIENLGRELLDGRNVLQARVVDDYISIHLEAVERPEVGEVGLQRLTTDAVGDLSGGVTV